MTKIIAVDLDGTLLNSDSQEISDFTKETIKKLLKKGIRLLITTGRPYRMSKDFTVN